MRVSPVGWAFESEEEILHHAELSALPSHNHPEGIKGAQAIALAIFMVRKGASNVDIKSKISSMFGYNLDRTIDLIRPTYHFEVICQTSVPEAIICFLEATSFEDAVRNAVSLGGDTDTQGAMAGSIAEARWGVPDFIRAETLKRLDQRLTNILNQFEARYGV
jgi:ADP-ribosylglycohydrolase